MLDFNKHKKKWKEKFPMLTDKELEYHFNLRADFWSMIVDNYEHLDLSKRDKN